MSVCVCGWQEDMEALQRSFTKQLREMNEKYDAQSEQVDALQQKLRTSLHINPVSTSLYDTTNTVLPSIS